MPIMQNWIKPDLCLLYIQYIGVPASLHYSNLIFLTVLLAEINSFPQRVYICTYLLYKSFYICIYTRTVTPCDAAYAKIVMSYFWLTFE